MNLDEKPITDGNSYFNNTKGMHSCMVKVLEKLSVVDRLRAARASKFFKEVAMDPDLWSRVAFKGLFVNDWAAAFAFLKERKTTSIDLRRMLLPRPSELNYMWEDFVTSIENVTTLEEIYMCECSDSVVSSLLKSFPRLKIFEAYEINASNFSCEVLTKSTNLEELVLNGFSVLDDQQHFRTFALEGKLTVLTLTGIENISQDVVETIEKCRNLEVLDLGQCNQFTADLLGNTLAHLTKLRKVRLEELGDTYPYLYELGKLPDLICLELINIKVRIAFKTAIQACKNVSILLIIPNYIEKAADTNTILMETIPLLKNTLRFLGWGFTLELIRATDLYMMHNQKRPDGTLKFDGQQSGKCVPVTINLTSTVPPENSNNMVVLYIYEIEVLLLKQVPNTNMNLFSCNHKSTYRMCIPQNIYRKPKNDVSRNA